jgi:hypothetical protein
MVPEIETARSGPIRAGVYERVSKLAGARDRKEIQKARSIEEQNKANLEECARHGWTIADRYPDPGLSVSRFATKDRPEYKRPAYGRPQGTDRRGRRQQRPVLGGRVAGARPRRPCGPAGMAPMQSQLLMPSAPTSRCSIVYARS